MGRATLSRVQLDDRVGLAPERREALEAAAGAHRTLSEVVRWALAENPPWAIAEVIVQDEFTHDVVLGGGDLWLVYDTT